MPIYDFRCLNQDCPEHYKTVDRIADSDELVSCRSCAVVMDKLVCCPPAAGLRTNHTPKFYPNRKQSTR